MKNKFSLFKEKLVEGKSGYQKIYFAVYLLPVPSPMPACLYAAPSANKNQSIRILLIKPVIVQCSVSVMLSLTDNIFNVIKNLSSFELSLMITVYVSNIHDNDVLNTDREGETTARTCLTFPLSVVKFKSQTKRVCVRR